MLISISTMPPKRERENKLPLNFSPWWDVKSKQLRPFLFTKLHTRLAYPRFAAAVVGKAAKFLLLESWPHALQKSEDIQIFAFCST